MQCRGEGSGNDRMNPDQNRDCGDGGALEVGPGFFGQGKQNSDGTDKCLQGESE